MFFLLIIIDSVGFSHKEKLVLLAEDNTYPFIRTTISPQTHSLKQLKEMTSQIALRSLKCNEGIHRIAHDLHHIIKFPLIRNKSVTSGVALQY